MSRPGGELVDQSGCIVRLGVGQRMQWRGFDVSARDCNLFVDTVAWRGVRYVEAIADDLEIHEMGRLEPLRVPGGAYGRIELWSKLRVIETVVDYPQPAQLEFRWEHPQAMANRSVFLNDVRWRGTTALAPGAETGRAKEIIVLEFEAASYEDRGWPEIAP